MVNLIRRFQQPLMIAITFLVIIAFAWLYNDTRFMDKIGSDRVASIYGQKISQAQFLRSARKFEICRELMLVDLLQTLAGRATSMDQATESFIWNSIVLNHEAERLGIAPTNEEVIAAIQEMPLFLTNGAYDSAKYSQFVQRSLTPRGFTQDQLEEIVRDDLRLRKIKTLLGTTIQPAPSEVRSLYEQRNQVNEISYVQLKLDDFLKAATVSDEEVTKLFEERKASLKSDELRKVKFVAFILPVTDKPLTGKERVDSLQKLARQAEEFSVAMAEKDAKFEEVAAKFAVKVEETGEFSKGNPPPELGNTPAAATAAFRFTKADPNSDAIGSDRGYYVLQLNGITEARPLSFEEARPKLVEQIKQEKAGEALTLKAAELRNKIEAETKAGKSFAEAAQTAGAKAESFPPFSLADPKLDHPHAREIITASIDLREGEIGPFVPAQYGGLILQITKRLPIDETKFAQEKSAVAENVARSKREAIFAEWLKLRRAEAQLQTDSRG